jgi:hypothetical protein
MMAYESAKTMEPRAREHHPDCLLHEDAAPTCTCGHPQTFHNADGCWYTGGGEALCSCGEFEQTNTCSCPSEADVDEEAADRRERSRDDR